MGNVADTTMKGSVVLQSKAEYAFQILNIATRKYCSINHTSVSDPENLHKLETSFGLFLSVNLTFSRTPLQQLQRETPGLLQ